MSKKLSVVIPVYNVERYLGECVASVQAQQYKDYEIILVDDGSKDSSGAICDRLAASDPARVRVIHKANAGLGMARNTGIEAATGDYITFLDSDDTIHPEAYRACIEVLEANHADQARFLDHHITDGEPTDGGNILRDARVFIGFEAIRHIAGVLFGRPYDTDNAFDLGGSACMAVYRLDIIRDNNLRFHSERELVSEDFIFNYDYYMATESVVWLPRQYYNYRVVHGSLTHSNHQGKMERVEKYCRFIADMLRRDGFGAHGVRYVQAYCIMMLRVCAKYVLTDPEVSKAEKRAWFDRHVRGGYFGEHCKDYPQENMSRAQKLMHRAMCGGHYHLVRLLAGAMLRLKG
ncbi:MAG: glycosyltransferase family 2 protein [Muribaculaceae bacterium]